MKATQILTAVSQSLDTPNEWKNIHGEYILSETFIDTYTNGKYNVRLIQKGNKATLYDILNIKAEKEVNLLIDQRKGL